MPHINDVSDKCVALFWSKVNKDAGNGCWEWLAHYRSFGYGGFQVKRKPVLAHRLAWVMQNGNIPKTLLVLHKCDNRRYVNPDHLFLGSHKDNAVDRNNKGRQASHVGELNGRSKLTVSHVIVIRAYSHIVRNVDMSRLLDVTKTTIGNVINRKLWGHI